MAAANTLMDDNEGELSALNFCIERMDVPLSAAFGLDTAQPEPPPAASGLNSFSSSGPPPSFSAIEDDDSDGDDDSWSTRPATPYHEFLELTPPSQEVTYDHAMMTVIRARMDERQECERASRRAADRATLVAALVNQEAEAHAHCAAAERRLAACASADRAARNKAVAISRLKTRRGKKRAACHKATAIHRREARRREANTALRRRVAANRAAAIERRQRRQCGGQ